MSYGVDAEFVSGDTAFTFRRGLLTGTHPITAMFTIKTGTYYTSAFGCRFCLHVGTVAVFIGRARRGRRLEVCTLYHWFRWSIVGER